MTKNIELWVAVAGLFLAWKMYQSSKPKAAGVWQSFPGGIQIDPNGNYYVDGKLVWSPTAYGNA